MRVINRPRAGGKTHEIIKLCAEKGGYIVCFNRQEANRVFHVAKNMGLKVPLPITFREFIERKYHAPGITQFLIDNLDICIQEISPVLVEAISMNATVPPQAEKT